MQVLPAPSSNLPRNSGTLAGFGLHSFLGRGFSLGLRALSDPSCLWRGFALGILGTLLVLVVELLRGPTNRVD